MDDVELFLGISNHTLEQDFCRMLSENDQVELFFEHYNRAFTDGHRIVCDPQWHDLYNKPEVLNAVEDFLKVPHHLAGNIWDTLKVFTRFQTIHECLHILYSEFRDHRKDPYCRKSRNKASAMAHTDNIIEDAYVDAVGIQTYQNAEFYIRFGRALQQYVPHNAMEDILYDLYPAMQNYSDYIQYMALEMLYPFIPRPKVNSVVQEYISKTIKLFKDGYRQPTPALRYKYVRRIFKIIEPLIPADKDAELDSWTETITIFPDHRTHAYNNRISPQRPKGKDLYDPNGNDAGNVSPNERMMEEYQADLLDFASDKKKSEEDEPIMETLQIYVPKNLDLDCQIIHDNIKIRERKYGSPPDLARIYHEILNKNKSIIDTYISRLSLLLRGYAEVKEDKQIIGHGISSKHFADPKRRFWYKIQKGIDVPEISILFLLDGSGSMSDIIHGVRRTSVIMHEVLGYHNIEHCFVEHRAIYNEPRIDINILYGFGDKEVLKYNLLKSCADNCNRDSLALLWADRYLRKHASTENRIIISLSDGLPYHPIDNYCPPASSQDAKDTIHKITKRGTKVIAVALDGTDNYSNYDNLRAIYKNLIGCNDISRLPGQLLRIISKELEV